jgi:protein involved in polysaccharide export with SLBB domain
MRKILIIFVFGLFFNVNAQEMNQAFLNSLSPEMKEDLIERNKANIQNEDKVYRSIENSSTISKKDESITRSDEEVFGASFFNTFQSSFMPINQPNLDDSYILDFGDILEIQVIGSNDSIIRYEINRNGSINLPDVGKLFLSGKTLLEATSHIQKKIEEIYIGSKAFVSLVSIRDVSVLVSGDAENPGVYTLSGNSNLLHALNIAGGVSEFGSYREIKLIRNNEIIETVDIYDVLINGKYSSKARLKNGDLIFVEPRKNIVEIGGAVKRKAKYELHEDQTLQDVLDYANGFDIYADLDNMYLKRVADGVVREIPIPNLAQYKRITAKDGDVVFVREYNFRKVRISGSVLNPSEYLMRESDTLFDLIEKAGGYTKNAYPFGAIYTNVEALQTSIVANDILYEKFLDNILQTVESSVGGSLDIGILIDLAKNIKDTTPTGRVTIDLLEPDDSRLLYVKDGDTLTIPELNNNIYIYGEVNQSGVYAYKDLAELEYYIGVAGGFKDSADTRGVYVLLPNGNTKKLSISKNIFSNQPIDAELYPGSVIFVPRKINNSGNRALAAQAYASILGNIGVSVASLAVLKD